MIKPYYDDGNGIVIYHGDCRDVLPTLPKVDAIVTDPPYGMNNDADYTRFSGGKRPPGRGNMYENIQGDNEPFDPKPLLRFDRVILWGANHFSARLPVGSTLIWIKKHDHQFGTFLSDAEVGWQKGGHGVYCYRHIWNGFDRGQNNREPSQIHPNQKPVDLMGWCVKRVGVPADATIVDPYCGTGPTLVAARGLGLSCIGIEIEEKYCEIAVQRLSQEVLAL